MYSRDSPNPHPTKSPTPSRYQQKNHKGSIFREDQASTHDFADGSAKSKLPIQPMFQRIRPIRPLNGRRRERSLVSGGGIQSLHLGIGTTIREAVEGFPRGMKLHLSKDGGSGWGGRNAVRSVTRRIPIRLRVKEKKDTVLRFVGEQKLCEEESPFYGYLLNREREWQLKRIIKP